MKHQLVLPVCLLISFVASCQEFRVSSKLGFAIEEMKRTDLKKVTLFNGITFGLEIPLKDNLCLGLSTGFSVLRFDYTEPPGSNIFHNQVFLNLPVTIRKYFPVSKKSQLFFDAGLQAGYFLIDKREARSNSVLSIDRKRGLGWNFGTVGSLCFKAAITKSVSFDIGFSGTSDYLFSYANSADKVETMTTALVSSFWFKF